MTRKQLNVSHCCNFNCFEFFSLLLKHGEKHKQLFRVRFGEEKESFLSVILTQFHCNEKWLKLILFDILNSKWIDLVFDQRQLDWAYVLSTQGAQTMNSQAAQMIEKYANQIGRTVTKTRS